jgi:hypothetical protein
MHLRAYLEDRTDCLFSWISFFLVGDFWWQRRDEPQGYTDYRGVFCIGALPKTLRSSPFAFSRRTRSASDRFFPARLM